MKTAHIAFLLALLAQDNPAQQVPELIAQLRSAEFKERVEAARRLKEIGPPALSLLEQAIKDKDSEVAYRARDLVRQIRLRQTFTPRLLREIPGIEDRLDTPDSKVWTLEFLKLLDSRWKGEELTGLTSADLEPLIGRAFAGAKDEKEIGRLIEASSKIGLRGAFSALERLAQDSSVENAELANSAMRAMTLVDGPSAVPVLLGFLKNPKLRWRMDVVQVLRIRPGAPKVVETVRTLLKDPDDSVRSEAALLLGVALDIPSIPALETLLRDRDRSVRIQAAEALASLASKHSAGAIRKLLKDPEEDVRGAAVKSLGILGAVEAGAEIEATLKKAKDWGILLDGADALGRLGRREAVGTLVAISQSKERHVKGAVIRALLRVGAQAEAIALARKMLKAKEWPEIEFAAGALGNMEVKESADLLIDALSTCPREAQQYLVRALSGLELPKCEPVFRKFLRDENSSSSDAAQRGLARLEAKEKPPGGGAPVPPVDTEKLLRALGDTKPDVRMDALIDLRCLNVSVPENRMADLLSDPNERVRQWAVHLANQLGYPGLLPRIRTLTQDESWHVADEALEGLAWRGELADQEVLKEGASRAILALSVCKGLSHRTDGKFQDLLEELLLHRDGEVRHKAGDVLCRRGSSIGVPAVLAQDFDFFALNALRNSDQYRKLAGMPSVGPHPGDPRELLARAGKAGGFEVLVPPLVPEEARGWWDIRGEPGIRWQRDSLLDDLRVAFNMIHNGIASYEVVIDADKVRIMSPLDAKIFWQQWWADFKK